MVSGNQNCWNNKFFVSRRPKTSKVRKFALNMDQNSTLDVSKKLFRKQNQNWKLILNEN